MNITKETKKKNVRSCRLHESKKKVKGFLQLYEFFFCLFLKNKWNLSRKDVIFFCVIKIVKLQN